MPSKKPRINVVCEHPLYYEISRIAEEDGASLSSVAHDLIREALELREDSVLAGLADERARTFRKEEAKTFDQVFGS
jgi:hypothetical protein